MNGKSVTIKSTVCLLVVALGLAIICYAQKEQQLWGVHDEKRPVPAVIAPPEAFGQPPADAIILFDGKDTSQWVSDKGGGVKWKVENGCMEVVKGTGGIHTVKSFGNCQLHIEWATPEVVAGKGQGRGNGGVFFMSRYELQVLDSCDNQTYADGQAASIYGQYPPLVNVSRKPGQWQSYDVSFLRPVFDDKGNCIRPARITVFHNGVVVQNNVEIQGSTAHKVKAKYSRHEDTLPLALQEHGNPMRFRNIWIRALPEQPYLIAD